MKGTVSGAILAQTIQRGGDGFRIWVQFCHSVQSAVDFADARGVGANQVDGGEEVAFQAVDEVF